jgi:hypothetical protein
MISDQVMIIRDAPDTDFAEYPANLKAGYPAAFFSQHLSV